MDCLFKLRQNMIKVKPETKKEIQRAWERDFFQNLLAIKRDNVVSEILVNSTLNGRYYQMECK